MLRICYFLFVSFSFLTFLGCGEVAQRDDSPDEISSVTEEDCDEVELSGIGLDDEAESTDQNNNSDNENDIGDDSGETSVEETEEEEVEDIGCGLNSGNEEEDCPPPTEAPPLEPMLYVDRVGASQMGGNFEVVSEDIVNADADFAGLKVGEWNLCAVSGDVAIYSVSIYVRGLYGAQFNVYFDDIASVHEHSYYSEMNLLTSQVPELIGSGDCVVLTITIDQPSDGYFNQRWLDISITSVGANERVVYDRAPYNWGSHGLKVVFEESNFITLRKENIAQYVEENGSEVVAASFSFWTPENGVAELDSVSVRVDFEGADLVLLQSKQDWVGSPAEFVSTGDILQIEIDRDLSYGNYFRFNFILPIIVEGLSQVSITVLDVQSAADVLVEGDPTEPFQSEMVSETIYIVDSVSEPVVLLNSRALTSVDREVWGHSYTLDYCENGPCPYFAIEGSVPYPNNQTQHNLDSVELRVGVNGIYEEVPLRVEILSGNTYNYIPVLQEVVVVTPGVESVVTLSPDLALNGGNNSNFLVNVYPLDEHIVQDSLLIPSIQFTIQDVVVTNPADELVLVRYMGNSSAGDLDLPVEIMPILFHESEAWVTGTTLVGPIQQVSIANNDGEEIELFSAEIDLPYDRISVCELSFYHGTGKVATPAQEIVLYVNNDSYSLDDSQWDEEMVTFSLPGCMYLGNSFSYDVRVVMRDPIEPTDVNRALNFRLFDIQAEVSGVWWSAAETSCFQVPSYIGLGEDGPIPLSEDNTVSGAMIVITP